MGEGLAAIDGKIKEPFWQTSLLIRSARASA